MMKEKLLVSACLLGENCKYSGGNNRLPEEQLKALEERYNIISVCPEVLGGLPTPRTPSEIRGEYVLTAEGVDVTEAFRKGAEAALKKAEEQQCRKALLKQRSPSCGSGLRYDGTFSGIVIPGDGVTAAMLKEQGIPVFSENELEKIL